MQRTYIVTGSFQQSYDSFIFLLNDCQQSALLIYDTTPPKVGSFQNSFKRLRITCHSQDTTATGILKIPSVYEETAAYFSSILSYIDTNYARHLTLQDLAHEFGINYSYLSQLFKKTIGLSFAEHLTNIRLTHACDLLSDTFTPITDIAESVGFNDYHYFCNTFKRYYSMTPSQYRNASGKETNS